MSERKRLVAAISQLHSVIEQMHAAYLNDRAVDRAKAIGDFAERGAAIARPILDRYPPNYGRPLPNPSNEGGARG
jgi:hypothetical protein